MDSVVANSSGVSSMNLVWHRPDKNTGWVRMLLRKDMLVLTPRMRISAMARSILRAVPSKVLSKVVILTRRLS